MGRRRSEANLMKARPFDLMTAIETTNPNQVKCASTSESVGRDLLVPHSSIRILRCATNFAANCKCHRSACALVSAYVHAHVVCCQCVAMGEASIRSTASSCSTAHHLRDLWALWPLSLRALWPMGHGLWLDGPYGSYGAG